MTQEVGFVQKIQDFLITLDGLPSVQINDLIESEGSLALVDALYPNAVAALLLTQTPVKPQQAFTASKKRLEIGISENFLGRVINPLGTAIDGKKPLPPQKELFEIEKKAPPMQDRAYIKTQFLTGLTLIDMLTPLGKGQRQLILGDARAGKTSFLIDLIINQKQSNTICIYASIGKPITELKKLIDALSLNNAFSSTIVVAAVSSDPPPLIHLAPKTAMTIAEYFQKKGRDVLLILDDMGNHAKMYRELSLLEGKSPGRESYPGDIFYEHARLLERAGNFKPSNANVSGGSITALPVLEINLSDFFNSYIPTNIMAMTDGHLLFTSNLYNLGKKPAIDISLSVTRVGLQTQSRFQNLLAGKIKSILTLATQLDTISRFSTELPFETQQLLRQKDFIGELLSQERLISIPKDVQIALLSLIFTSFLSNKEKEFLKTYKKTIITAFLTDPALQKTLKEIATLEKEEDVFNKLESIVPILENLCQPSPK